ncbi:MAG: protein jag [Chloroflexi bacterium]|nr:protein jag [Chloroflexota bacterium]
MSETKREFSAKSVDDAIAKGLAELGLPRDAVDVEIVSEGTRGLLGIGSDAVVRLAPIASAKSYTDQDISAVAQEILKKLLDGMGMDARVEVLPDVASEDENAFVLNIVGEDLSVLIGRRGETLRDLEYLARLMVSSQTGKAKFLVDVEGYRTRRERQLRELAKRMATRVESNRQPITLEAMPPNERRIVHIALREHPHVKTHSIGEGDHRRVMILPK